MTRRAFVPCAVVLMALATPRVWAAQAELSGAWDPYRGRGGRGGDPALSAPPASPIVLRDGYRETWEARVAAADAATARGEPLPTASSQCIPYGMPSMMAVAIYPIEIIQTPEQITIITEAFSEVRRIYMDRPQFEIGAVAPGYYGRSVGHWEGDTLVVDTVGIKETVEYQRVPHSDQMRITERIRLTGPDVLQDEITIEDPVVLEMPITYTLVYRRLPGYEMVEFVCENNREYVDEEGVVRMRFDGN